MKKSILPLVTIAICTISVLHAMEELQYTNAMEINSPISKALLADHQAYIENFTENQIKKVKTNPVRTLFGLCILKIIESNITDLTSLPDELRNLIMTDAEYINKNPTLYKQVHVPCTSPSQQRFKVNRSKKIKTALHEPAVKRKLFHSLLG